MENTLCFFPRPGPPSPDGVVCGDARPTPMGLLLVWQFGFEIQWIRSRWRHVESCQRSCAITGPYHPGGVAEDWVLGLDPGDHTIRGGHRPGAAEWPIFNWIF